MTNTQKNLSHRQLADALRASGGRAMPEQAKNRVRSAILSAATHVTFSPVPRYKGHLTLTYKPMFAAIIIAVVLLGSTGTAIAADQSKPGDALFGLDQVLENVRLKLTLSDTAKADLAVEIAQERAEELNQLKQEEGDNAPTDAVLQDAESETDHALQQARETLSGVQSKLEDQGSDRARSAINRVREKFQELEERHPINANVNSAGLTEAEVTLRDGTATIKLEFNDQKLNFQLTGTDRDAIIKEIASRLGVPEAVVRSIVKFEDEQDETNSNSNRNTNSSGDEPDDNSPDEDKPTNGNVNASGSGSPDDSDASGSGTSGSNQGSDSSTNED